MKTLKFKCKLKSDVILNQKAATEGPNQTLDFIPGSCFLGIVASELYPNDKANVDYAQRMSKAMEIFHSGKVRFGDANSSKDGIRGVKIPASMFYPKLKKITDGEVYIHHEIPEEQFDAEWFKEKQVKQCRNGFYTFANKEAKQVETETSFAIKSAYDREKRRSKDEQMYGYESLQEGLELYFEVQVDNEDLAEKIKDALTKDGSKRVGRSRTAQYGLVEITPFEYSEIASGESQNNIVTVYADSRLIFLDEYGLPTFKPTEEQLGLPKEAKILWDKSQIRTFQYAPWNYQRQCFDTDRCGIEKGSVFVVDVSKCDNLPELKSRYLGSYNNEGFGKVVYNPEFLKAKEDGQAIYIIDDKAEKSSKPEKKTLSGSLLLDYIQKQQSEENKDNGIYSNVNKWVNDNKIAFQGKEKFASQWGAIRGIAMATKDDSKIKENVMTYIGHGVKSSDWDGNRRKKLEEFMKDNEKNIREALVNLAAEMAKKCKEEKQ